MCRTLSNQSSGYVQYPWHIVFYKRNNSRDSVKYDVSNWFQIDNLNHFSEIPHLLRYFKIRIDIYLESLDVY